MATLVTSELNVKTEKRERAAQRSHSTPLGWRKAITHQISHNENKDALLRFIHNNFSENSSVYIFFNTKNKPVQMMSFKSIVITHTRTHTHSKDTNWCEEDNAPPFKQRTSATDLSHLWINPEQFVYVLRLLTVCRYCPRWSIQFRRRFYHVISS